MPAKNVSDGGGFDFSPFNHISPYQKISLFNTLVDDPEDSNSWPDYRGINNEGYYVYRSKDLKHSYFINNDGNDISIYKVQSTNTGLIDADYNINFPSIKSSYDVPFNSDKQSKFNTDPSGPTVGGNISLYSNEKEFFNIYSDGSKLSKSFSGNIVNFKGDIDPSDKKISTGIDLMGVEGKIMYYPAPQLIVNKFDSADVHYKQDGFGVSADVNVGMGIEIDFSKKLNLSTFKEAWDNGKFSPVSFSVMPNADITLGEYPKVNDMGVLSEKDFLKLQNEGINNLLNNSQSQEDADLDIAMQLSDPNFLGSQQIDFKPILTTEERNKLEQKLSQNDERLKNLQDGNPTLLDENQLQNRLDGNHENTIPTAQGSLAKGTDNSKYSNSLENKSEHHTLRYDEIFHRIQEGINELKNNLSKA